jgi:two-component sensor histidine kinase
MNYWVKFTERLPLLGNNQPLAIGLSLLVSVFACWLRWALNDVFPPGYPFVTFFPAVILSSFLFGTRSGAVAGVACGLLAWYVFVTPAYSFSFLPGTRVAMIFYVAVVAVDIALIDLMQKANAQLRIERERNRLLAEERGRFAERSDLLFRELQHRVANNLQMIGSVLALQIRNLEDRKARKALLEASNKLGMIGSIHRQLYDPSGDVVALDKFLSELTAQLMSAGGKPGVTHSLVADSGLSLMPDAAIPVALIIAEAIANAIEHGFADHDRGHISISLKRCEAGVEVSVTDDGGGLPIDFDLEAAGSLGIRISRILSQQLGASFSLERGHAGTVMRLALPNAQSPANAA